MKRQAIYIFMLLVAMLAMSSCTKNEGNIGYWFGLWHLDSIELDGVTDEDYDGSYYFKFQGEVFCISWVNNQTHDYDEHFAEWESSDDDSFLTINFVDNRWSPSFNDYQPNTYLKTITTLKVLTLNNTTMVLFYADEDTGVTVTYNLTRWD